MNCSAKVATRPRCNVRRLACGFAALAALGCFAASAGAAPPKITRLSVRGLQIGGVTRINIQGTDLGPETKLLLGVPIESQKLITQRPDGTVIEVVLPDSIAAGIEHLRVQTAGGVSAAELIALDGLPQLPIPLNPTATAPAAPFKLPVALHGMVAGSAVQEATFAGRKGEAIVVDVLARRFGSKLRPVVHLYDAARKQLAWSLPQSAPAGDARLTVTLPADGTYTVAVHDLTYAAAAPGYYRLAIGALDYVDAVYPPVVAAGAQVPLVGIGRGAEPALTVESATTDVAAGQALPLAWPDRFAPIGLRPFVTAGRLPELVEDRTLDAARKLPAAPVAVSGRLLTPGETDLYQLDLAANEKIRIDVEADRLGSPLDAVLELRDAKGARLAQNDDAVGPDPRLDYTAPKSPTTVTLAVGDALRRGDAGQIYRVVVKHLDDAATAQPDFRLSFADDTHNVPNDGTKLLRVTADRAGYDGPIRLTVADLPTGFSATTAEIPAGADGALVELRRTAESAGGEPRTITIRGESVGRKPALVRTAESSVHPLARLQPWLKYAAVVAASDSPGGPVVEWSDAAAKSSVLYVGTDDKLSVRVLRDPASTGIVRLSLLTSQAPPPADQQAAQAAALQLRGVAATVDVKPAASKPGDKPVAAAVPAEFALRIPPELRLAEYDVALKAELLAADGRTVAAESYSPPRRYRAAPPIALQADAPPTGPITLNAKSGATLSFSGSIERFQNYAGDVTVTLAGLPAGVTAPSAVLKSKGDKFKLDVKLPPNLAVDKLEGWKLTATLPAGARPTTPPLKIETPLPALAVKKPAQ